MSDPKCGVCGRTVMPKDVTQCKHCSVLMCKGCRQCGSDGSDVCAACLEARDKDPAAAMEVFDTEPEFPGADYDDTSAFDTPDDGGW